MESSLSSLRGACRKTKERVPAKPRILRIIARLNTGGPARHVTLLSAALQEKGYPHLLVAGRLGPGEGSLQELAENAGINLETVASLGPEIRPWRDLISFFQLIQIIRRFRPDIVHTHTAKAGFLGRLAARICGVPLVFHTFHGHVLRGYFSRPQEEVYRMLEILCAKISTRLVTLTQGLATELVNLGVAAKEKFRIIPLGLDLIPFLETRPHRELKAQLGLDSSTTLIGCVGRLAPVKNLSFMLEMMQPLAPSVHLVLVGDGEDRPFLEKKSRELKISHRVHFYGWCKNLPWMYGGLDLVVNCSKNEGTPVSLLEALTAGVPVLAAPVGGIPELFRETGIGDLWKETTHEGILRGLIDCLGNLSSRRPFAVARQKIACRFSVQSLVSRIEKMYQDSRGVA